MRRIIGEVSESVRDYLREWDDSRDTGMTDEEVVRRYATQHQGRPDRILNFVRQTAPEGTDPLDAAVEYERQMEDLLKARRNDAT
jgi:hypothetical protein